MKVFILLSFLAFSSITVAQKNKRSRIKKGAWIAELNLTQEDNLPFNLTVEKNGASYNFFVENGDERIALEAPELINDSLHLKFPYFNSQLVFAVNSKKHLSGYWQNFNKGPHYKIPFSAKRKKSSRFSMVNKRDEGTNYNGRWRVEFEPGTNSSYPAVGVFEQDIHTNKVAGTFLTETGDYRFLEGNATNDSLFLSCFDGSHAFLFKAAYRNEALQGKFFSGNHWQSEWTGSRDEQFELASPEDLTYLTDSSGVNFTLKSLDGEDYSFPNPSMEGKVVIIQIMGSWCPNCLDETVYYKELYEKYHDRGLEIISVGYETGDSFEVHAANIQRLRKKLALDFTFLVGGKANKGLASEHFDMLNGIISFPTSIYIGRDGMVKRIHTGFNGPGTGDYYTEYVKKTNALIEYLLAH